MLNRLNIVRDCYWAMASGNTYVTDENNNFSSHSEGLYKSLNSSDLEYIEFHGSGSVSYYTRLESSNIDIDSVFINLRADASISGDASIYINNIEIGTIGHIEAVQTYSNNFILNGQQRAKVLSGRINNNYDYCNINLNTPIDSGIQSKKLYDLEVFYSGDSTWDNHVTGLPNVLTSTYYPTSITQRDNSSWSGDVGNIAMSISDVGADSAYIEQEYIGDNSNTWDTSMPNGGLSLLFDNITEQPLTQITRARLNFRASLPPSGLYENARDTLEINGYNHRYKNQDDREDMDDISISQTNVHDGYGYFLYGAGSIIEQSGFMNYYTELNFLDPIQPSGNYKSTRHANIDMLANMEFKLIGVPSGTQISAAELQIEYIPNNSLSLYTAGNVYRSESSGTVDVGTNYSAMFGNGGWHHNGWKQYGPNTIEEEVFDNFYSFYEPSGTRTYPESTRTAYFTPADKDLTVYGDYVSLSPPGTFGASGDLTSLLKEPQRREYYRNPISATDLTPTHELPTLRDVASISPSRYRNMVYHGDSLDYFDVNLDGVDDNIIAPEDLCQIYFDDRISLGHTFTLYFMIYRDYGFTNNGRFFHRGLTRENDTNNYEIYGYLNWTNVIFRVQHSYGYTDITAPVNKNTRDPILIWFQCGYNAVTEGMTELKLSVNDHIHNYFGSDWKSGVSQQFLGYRKQYSEQQTVYVDPDTGDVSTILSGGPRTVLGTLNELTFSEQAANKEYLHRASICEFGYSNNYIDLETNTSDTSVISGYDVSLDKDKRFLSSRVANNEYVQTNPSGVNWVVPYGSGEAKWSTTYSIDSMINENLRHSLFNPISTAGTNNVVAPSGIYIDLEAAHSTDHPSGVKVFVDVEFDSGTSENWKMARSEFTIPSGGGSFTGYQPITFREGINKHVNMDGGVITYSDVTNANVTVTTKYLDIDTTEYYGDFTIHSLNVYFDSFCVAGTGIDALDLFTNGSAQTIGSADDTSLDLYTIGSVSSPTNPDDGSVDLYMYGWPHIASGDITPLFIEGDPVQKSNTNMSLYIPGLDPPNTSGNINLFTWGTNSPGIRDNMDLYISSNLDPDWRLPLYLDGGIGQESTNINLFIENDPWTFTSTAIDSQVLLESGLYIGIDEFNEPSGTIMFWMKPFYDDPSYAWWKQNQWQHVAMTWDSSSDGTPLYIDAVTYGVDHDVNSGFTEFNGNVMDYRVYDEILTSSEIQSIINDTTFMPGMAMMIKGPYGIDSLSDDSILPLYINTPSGTDGYYWKNGSINLYIDRDSEAVANNLSLYMAQHTTTNTVNLLINGSDVLTSSVPFYIYGSGTPSATQELYTHGF